MKKSGGPLLAEVSVGLRSPFMASYGTSTQLHF